MQFEKYALLDEDDYVTYIGTIEEYQNSEDHLKWIGLLPDMSVQVGFKYDFKLREFKRVRKPLEDERRLLLGRINDVYHSKMKMLLHGYDDYEISTFPFQIMGCNDYRDNDPSGIGYIFMLALSEGRKKTLHEMVERTEKKTRQFVYLGGYLTGTRQRLEEYALSATDIKQIDEVEEHLQRWNREALMP